MPEPGESLADDLTRLNRYIANPSGLRDPESPPPTATVEAPCCGNRCAGDMVVHVPGEGWCCDVCRRRLERDDSTPWTRAKILRAIGASPEDVREEVIRRETQRRAIAIKHSGETLNRREVAETVREEIERRVPDGEFPPDTEPPVDR